MLCFLLMLLLRVFFPHIITSHLDISSHKSKFKSFTFRYYIMMITKRRVIYIYLSNKKMTYMSIDLLLHKKGNIHLHNLKS